MVVMSNQIRTCYWIPPNHGWWSLSYDGSLIAECVGYGGLVIRDEMGAAIFCLHRCGGSLQYLMGGTL